jgi:ABC transporter substrate binding protein
MTGHYARLTSRAGADGALPDFSEPGRGGQKSAMAIKRPSHHAAGAAGLPSTADRSQRYRHGRDAPTRQVPSALWTAAVGLRRRPLKCAIDGARTGLSLNGALLMIRRRKFIAGIGSAAVWPVTARAQQTKLPVIGRLIAATLPPTPLMAFRQGLAEHGYVEGRNVAILDRLAEGEYDRLPALAAELVRQNVAVLVTTPNTPAALAAQAATRTIPIIFIIGTNPVEYGLVRSLARPGGNVTGFTGLVALAALRSAMQCQRSISTARSSRQAGS